MLFGGPDLLAHHATSRGQVRTVSTRFTTLFYHHRTLYLGTKKGAKWVSRRVGERASE